MIVNFFKDIEQGFKNKKYIHFAFKTLDQTFWVEVEYKKVENSFSSLSKNGFLWKCIFYYTSGTNPIVKGNPALSFSEPLKKDIVEKIKKKMILLGFKEKRKEEIKQEKLKLDLN